MQFRLKVLLALAALVGAVAMNAAPAGASPGAGVFVFSAPAVLTTQVFAPVGVNNGSCNNDLPAPANVGLLPRTVGPVTVGVCNQVAGGYNFDTLNPPPGFNSVCIGAAADLGSGTGWVGLATSIEAFNKGVMVFPGACRLWSTGTLGASAVGLGAWCGLSGGSGVANTSLTFAVSVPPVLGTVTGTGSVDWLVSAGTVLPLVFGLSSGPVGVGAVQTTGPTPGPCGLASLAGNPAGASTFQVTGFAVVAG